MMTDRKLPLFAHDPALINHRFESYKVTAVSDEEDAASDEVASPEATGQREGVRQRQFALPSGVQSISSSSKHTLGYKELKDRANVHRLAPARRQGQAAYIDENGFVILVNLAVAGTANEDVSVAYSPVYKVSDHNADQQEGFAHIVAGPQLDSWLISDGSGLLTLLQVSRQESTGRWSGRAVRSWKWLDEETEKDTAFHVIAVQHGDGDTPQDGTKFKVLLQRMRKVAAKTDVKAGIGSAGNGGSMSAKVQKRAATQTLFDLAIAELDGGNHADEDAESFDEGSVQMIDISTVYQCEEPPYHSFFDDDGSAMLFAEAAVQCRDSKDKSPKVAAASSTKSSASTNLSTGAATRKLPLYAWTQTPETVTVAFSLPLHTTKNDVDCRLTAHNLHLSQSVTQTATIREISETGGSQGEDANWQAILSGAYADRLLWGEIDAQNSVWTFEKYGAQNLLTFHLEKKHEGTRWPSVIQSRNSDDEPLEEEVPETMDPSELVAMLEGMQKYVSGTEEEQSYPHDTREQASLLHDGLEEEDALVGRTCVVSRLRGSPSAGEVGPLLEVLDKSNSVALATRLPSSVTLQSRQGIVTKRDLDGLVFAKSESKAPQQSPFKHVDTLPALSYVLASKRDVGNQVFFATLPGRPTAILAFDSPSFDHQQAGGAESGSLFVYRSPMQATQGQSYVIRLAPFLLKQENSASIKPSVRGGSAGRVIDAIALDVGVDRTQQSSPLLVVLCERCVITLQNVL